MAETKQAKIKPRGPTAATDEVVSTRRGFRRHLATAAKLYVFANSAVFFTAFFWTLSSRIG